MKARKIYETQFKKGQKPVGMDSESGMDHWIEKWQDKGLNFGWQYFKDKDEHNARDFTRRYHREIEKYLKLLNEAGIPYANMTLWGDHIDAKTYQLLKGNWALFHCITEEDAKMVKEFIENMTTGNSNIVIKEDRDHINIADRIHKETDEDHRKWMERMEKSTGEKRRTDLDFLDKIHDIRKKLRSIL